MLICVSGSFKYHGAVIFSVSRAYSFEQAQNYGGIRNMKGMIIRSIFKVVEGRYRWAQNSPTPKIFFLLVFWPLHLGRRRKKVKKIQK